MNTMEGFMYYKLAFNDYYLTTSAEDRVLDFEDSDMINLINSAKEELYAGSGELATFSHPEVLSAIRQKLTDNPDFKFTVICGDKIIADLNEETNELHNAFLDMIIDNFSDRLQKNIFIYYNKKNVLQQISEGYTHCVVADLKNFSLEQPHSYQDRKDKNDRPSYSKFMVYNREDVCKYAYSILASYLLGSGLYPLSKKEIASTIVKEERKHLKDNAILLTESNFDEYYEKYLSELQHN